MTEQKFCVDCKWWKERFALPNDLSLCMSPKRSHQSTLVDGKIYYDKQFADLCRSYNNKCGEKGSWWEPKPPTYWQKLKTYFQ